MTSSLIKFDMMCDIKSKAKSNNIKINTFTLKEKE